MKNVLLLFKLTLIYENLHILNVYFLAKNR